MNPWLLHLDVPLVGTVSIQSYFFWMMAGCLVAAEVAVREARRSGESPAEILRLSVAAILLGLLGARSAHFIFVAPGTLIDDPLVFFKVWRGGMVFYGGLIGGLLATFLWSRARGLPLLRVGDILAAPVMMGLALGRIGCFSGGCCYGRPIDWGSGYEWPWAVTFLSGGVPLELQGIPLHPTQAYASILAVLIFLLITRIRRSAAAPGLALGTMLVTYAISRSTLELFRFDVGRQFFFEETWGQVLSTSQGISVPMVILGAVLIRRAQRVQHTS